MDIYDSSDVSNWTPAMVAAALAFDGWTYTPIMDEAEADTAESQVA